jgi:hypothetical protein
MIDAGGGWLGALLYGRFGIPWHAFNQTRTCPRYPSG